MKNITILNFFFIKIVNIVLKKLFLHFQKVKRKKKYHFLNIFKKFSKIFIISLRLFKIYVENLKNNLNVNTSF